MSNINDMPCMKLKYTLNEVAELVWLNIQERGFKLDRETVLICLKELELSFTKKDIPRLKKTVFRISKDNHE